MCRKCFENQNCNIVVVNIRNCKYDTVHLLSELMYNTQPHKIFAKQDEVVSLNHRRIPSPIARKAFCLVHSPTTSAIDSLTHTFTIGGATYRRWMAGEDWKEEGSRQAC